MKKSYSKFVVIISVALLGGACSSDGLSSTTGSVTSTNSQDASQSSSINISSSLLVSSESEKPVDPSGTELGEKAFSFYRLLRQEASYTINGDSITEIQTNEMCKKDGVFSTEKDTSTFKYSVSQDSLKVWSSDSSGLFYMGSGNVLEGTKWRNLGYGNLNNIASIDTVSTNGNIRLNKKWQNGVVVSSLEGEFCWSSSFVENNKNHKSTAKGCNSIISHLPEGDLQLTLKKSNVSLTAYEYEGSFGGKSCSIKKSESSELQLNSANCTKAWEAYQKDPEKDEDFYFDDYNDSELETKNVVFKDCLKGLGVKTSIDSL